MIKAEASLRLALLVEGGYLAAPFACLGYDIHHLWLLVIKAEASLRLALLVEGGLLAALFARLVLNVRHPCLPDFVGQSALGLEGFLYIKAEFPLF